MLDPFTDDGDTQDIGPQNVTVNHKWFDGKGVTGRDEIGHSTAEPCIPAFIEEQVPGKITGTPSGLSRIFPNPADGPISIHYALDRTTAIRLEIHDSEGRMIRYTDY